MLMQLYMCLYIYKTIVNLFHCVETLGDPYYKRVPLPHIPEYRAISQDSQLLKPTAEIATVELNIISNYPNGY